MNRFVALSALLFWVTCFSAQKTDPPKRDQSPVIEHWLNVAQEMAKAQKITTVDDPVETFELRDKAIFRHTQSVRGDDIGAVYLWTTANGRPAAIGVFFAWSQGRDRWVMQEFHSLHSRPIRKTMEGYKTWDCPIAGIEWKPFAGAGEPKSDARE